jgi:hypothetical protein
VSPPVGVPLLLGPRGPRDDARELVVWKVWKGLDFGLSPTEEVVHKQSVTHTVG